MGSWGSTYATGHKGEIPTHALFLQSIGSFIGAATTSGVYGSGSQPITEPPNASASEYLRRAVGGGDWLVSFQRAVAVLQGAIDSSDGGASSSAAEVAATPDAPPMEGGYLIETMARAYALAHTGDSPSSEDGEFNDDDATVFEIHESGRLPNSNGFIEHVVEIKGQSYRHQEFVQVIMEVGRDGRFLSPCNHACVPIKLLFNDFNRRPPRRILALRWARQSRWTAC